MPVFLKVRRSWFLLSIFLVIIAAAASAPVLQSLTVEAAGQEVLPVDISIKIDDPITFQRIRSAEVSGYDVENHGAFYAGEQVVATYQVINNGPISQVRTLIIDIFLNGESIGPANGVLDETLIEMRVYEKPGGRVSPYRRTYEPRTTTTLQLNVWLGESLKPDDIIEIKPELIIPEE